MSSRILGAGSPLTANMVSSLSCAAVQQSGLLAAAAAAVAAEVVVELVGTVVWAAVDDGEGFVVVDSEGLGLAMRIG